MYIYIYIRYSFVSIYIYIWYSHNYIRYSYLTYMYMYNIYIILYIHLSGDIWRHIYRYIWHSFAFHPCWVFISPWPHPHNTSFSCTCFTVDGDVTSRRRCRITSSFYRGEKHHEKRCKKHLVDRSKHQLFPYVSICFHDFRWPNPTLSITVRPGAGGRSSLPKGSLAAPVSANAAVWVSTSSCGEHISESPAFPNWTKLSLSSGEMKIELLHQRIRGILICTEQLWYNAIHSHKKLW